MCFTGETCDRSVKFSPDRLFANGGDRIQQPGCDLMKVFVRTFKQQTLQFSEFPFRSEATDPRPGPSHASISQVVRSPTNPCRTVQFDKIVLHLKPDTELQSKGMKRSLASVIGTRQRCAHFCRQRRHLSGFQSGDCSNSGVDGPTLHLDNFGREIECLTFMTAADRGDR